MRLRSACALAALALAGAATAASATSIDFNASFNPAAGYTSINPDLSTGAIHVTGGTFYDTDSDDLRWVLGDYTFDLNLTVDPSSGPYDPTGSSTQTYTGDYTLYFDNTSFATGTVTARGLANISSFPLDTGEMLSFGNINFTSGRLTYVRGPGHDPFPGTGDFTFQGQIFAGEGVNFAGTISTAAAATAVPLPASATAGLVLLGLLGAGHAARRRFRTA